MTDYAKNNIFAIVLLSIIFLAGFWTDRWIMNKKFSDYKIRNIGMIGDSVLCEKQKGVYSCTCVKGNE